MHHMWASYEVYLVSLYLIRENTPTQINFSRIFYFKTSFFRIYYTTSDGVLHVEAAE